MIRDTLIDTAIRLHADEPLLKIRATLSSRYAGHAQEQAQLRSVLASHLTPTSNCIDIGAYRGRVLAEMIRAAPHGGHIAYEPLPHMHRLLVRRFPSVDVRLAAVSSERGETTFTIVHDSPGLSGFRDRWQGDAPRGEADAHRREGIDVRVETLDSDLPPGYVPHFIKVDVEGAERLVFEGGIRTIAEHRPTIMFEHGKGGADHYGTGPNDIHALLTREGGLRIFDMDGHGPYSEAEFEDAFDRNERWDFVACA